ncbi:MAG TPA: inorganic phosphate transporter, partial [Nitrospira sp.]|nr:inorganic phosphate transporter [Nitrospira sp.]
MPELSGLLLATVVLALLFDFSNGWHDCANAVATVVSTRVLRPLTAVLLAGALNVAGAFFSTAVAKMIGGGIVFPDAITNVVVAGAMAGAICWNLFTLILGLPTSSSHALIGGLVGAAVAHGGWAVVQFKGLNKILEAMILSPLLGFGMGFLIMVLVSWSFFRVHRGVATKLFSRLQLVSASFMAFSHGANDAQKVMGVITLALVASGQLTSTDVPTWVIVSCALAMGLGTTVGGWR